VRVEISAQCGNSAGDLGADLHGGDGVDGAGGLDYVADLAPVNFFSEVLRSVVASKEARGNGNAGDRNYGQGNPDFLCVFHGLQFSVLFNNYRGVNGGKLFISPGEDR